MCWMAFGGLAQQRSAMLLEQMLHNPKYVLVVAHRGDWRNHPENSLPAIASCIEQGVDMVEIDLQRTKDGVLILMHDPTLDRTTNGHGRVDEHTYPEIAELRLKAMHGACLTRNHVPTLQEALELCKGKILVNIDKGYQYYEEVLALVARGFLNKEIADQLCISLPTVISHRKNICEKLHLRSVSSLTIYAVTHGIVRIEDI